MEEICALRRFSAHRLAGAQTNSSDPVGGSRFTANVWLQQSEG